MGSNMPTSITETWLVSLVKAIKNNPDGLAVLMSDGPGGNKWMYVGWQHHGKCFKDMMGHFGDQCVWINKEGWGEFRTPGGNVSVWTSVK